MLWRETREAMLREISHTDKTCMSLKWLNDCSFTKRGYTSPVYKYKLQNEATCRRPVGDPYAPSSLLIAHRCSNVHASLILMTASHLSTTQVQASLQKDSIPFGFALGLSLITLVPAVSRLWGCCRVPNLTRWHLLICCLSPASSVSLFAIVVSKVYEKYHGPYLGLILVNSACSALYEVFIVHRMVLLLLSSI